MTELEQKIGYEFKDKSLLLAALTHSSYANERHTKSYERLEFLGDSVLGFVTAETLYTHEPEISEGKMTKLRSENVNTKALSSHARKLGLGSSMLFSKGEKLQGGADKNSNLEDAMEALIGAIFLDSGIESAKRFILEHVLDEIDFDEIHLATDNKSMLQEFLQANGDVNIRYEIVSESGPDHDKSFEAVVTLDGKELGRGFGKSKKEAQEQAAGMALEKYR